MSGVFGVGLLFRSSLMVNEMEQSAIVIGVARGYAELLNC